jgi:hypothetical protein
MTKTRPTTTGKLTFASWARRYRAAARQDDHRAIAAWLEARGFDPDTAPDLAKSTVRRVAFVCALYQMDKRPDLDAFLSLQTYDLSKSAARYWVRFEPYDSVYLAINEFTQLDLAELYGATPGFIHLYIEHIDDSAFSPEELAVLETAIRDDFAYDYAPDELTIEVHADGSGILVNVCEADERPPWLG